MKRIILFCICFLPTLIFAQFAIINDADGYSNVRKSADKTSGITDKLNNNTLVFGYDPENNRVKIEYSKNGKDLFGYVYYNRLKYIETYDAIPVTENESNTVILAKDTIKITVMSQKFDASKAKITYDKEQNVVSKISGKDYLGTDGALPKTEYKSIEITIGSKKVTLPKQALGNLFEPNLQNTTAYYDSKNDVMYLSAQNGDGSAGYNVIWKIEKGVYKEKLVVSTL